MEDEIIIKPIKGYELLYTIHSDGRIVRFDGFTPKQTINVDGYYCIGLRKDKITKTFKVHVLMAINFLGHIPMKNNMVVDHIDNNKLNNHLSNLQIITIRENTSKDRFRQNYTSSYVGVYWNKNAKKWHSSISVNRKRIHIGYFNSEIDAHNAYVEKLKSLDLK